MPSVPASPRCESEEDAYLCMVYSGTKLQARDSTPFWGKNFSVLRVLKYVLEWHRRFQKQRSLKWKTFEKFSRTSNRTVIGSWNAIRSQKFYISVWATIWGTNNIPILFTELPVRSLKTKCWIAFQALTETVAHWRFNQGWIRLHRDAGY